MLIDLIAGVFAALVLGGLVVVIIGMYNRLVRLDERCENAWSDIDVILTQRADALEKLVDAVTESMAYESSTLTKIVEARERAQAAQTPTEEAQADSLVQQALGGLSIRAEDHPDLNTVENLRALQTEIETLEERIADRREVYNESVTAHNQTIRQIPYVLVAGRLGFTARELFTADPADHDVDVGALLDDSQPSTVAQGGDQ